ncbi:MULTISPECIES: hypothetical protein [Methylobacterium]|jgi:hypothetical protein|uniref:Uncharacterized protein n=1 Tax=Methylobacterium hispanicum TaxID=270350 RepID=A0AAV4ZQ58_9HYPH|nr:MULTISPECIES: hypothetical protein [Methylobacterium]GJD90271.1 hypothetical protein BHAOGJBA_3809 [Methylobacterium hispanicum]
MPAAGRPDRHGRPMPDILFLAGGLAVFALAAGYAVLCERL